MGKVWEKITKIWVNLILVCRSHFGIFIQQFQFEAIKAKGLHLCTQHQTTKTKDSLQNFFLEIRVSTFAENDEFQ